MTATNGTPSERALALLNHADDLIALILDHDGWEPIPAAEQRQAEAWQAECRAAPEVARATADDEMDGVNTAAF